MKKVLVAVIICLLTTGFAFAAEKGTAKEAQDLVGKAVSYYKANGKDKTFTAINDPNGPFRKKDLYVYVFDFNTVCLAHGVTKGLIGKNLSDLKDPSGKRFMFEMSQAAKTKGKGWIDYDWTNPETKKMGHKSTYYQREGDIYFASGIYK